MQPDKIGLWKGPDTRSKCVLTMSLTQVGQWGAGALCGSVFDAIWPVSAVPKAQRGPKGAPKMKIFTFWLF